MCVTLFIAMLMPVLIHAKFIGVILIIFIIQQKGVTKVASSTI